MAAGLGKLGSFNIDAVLSTRGSNSRVFTGHKNDEMQQVAVKVYRRFKGGEASDDKAFELEVNLLRGGGDRRLLPKCVNFRMHQMDNFALFATGRF